MIIEFFPLSALPPPLPILPALTFFETWLYKPCWPETQRSLFCLTLKGWSYRNKSLSLAFSSSPF